MKSTSLDLRFAGGLPVLFLTLLALMPGARPAAAQSAVYLPQNGLVVVQAESLPLTGQWVIESSEAGYTGSGYLRYDGPNSLNTPGNGTLALSFRVNEPGEYFVKLRMSHLGAPAGDQENDCWMKMNDGGTWTKAVHPSGRMNEGFTFHTVLEPSGGVFASPLYDLSAGVNTVYLSGRSNNFRLDRIHIYKSTGVPDPENISYPESPKEGSGGSTGTLTVVNGTGDGTYPQGTAITVRANAAPAGQVFDRWTGATTHLANALAATTTLTMPAFDVTITATYNNEGTVVDLREPENPSGATQGIAFEYYEQTWDYLGDFDALVPTLTGVTDDIDLDEAVRADGYLLRFTGYLNAPTDGQYTLYTASDDGSQLFIGDRLVVDNDSIQSVQERSGTIGLKAGLHAITVTYFERTGDAALSASWAGPGFSKTEIPASALFVADGGGGGGAALGDVSLNGTISALDASQILIHAVGQILLEPASLAVGDVSGNGEVTAYDAALILRYVAGIITCFPAEEGCSDG